MTKIGLLSDTHGHIDEKLLDFFKDVDEIWHAGDIGDISVIEKLEKLKPIKAVEGNIDGKDIWLRFKEHIRFKIEDTNVWITHIGGYPGNYDRRVKPEIFNNPPDIFITGHSHILKIIYDKKIDCLHINPGAYGKSGFHKVRTAVRFEIDKKEIKNIAILEIKR